MKRTFLIIALACLFASCGSSYSPYDNYINAVMKGDSLNEASRIAAQRFIDSSNNAHVLIHLHYQISKP